MRQQGSNTSSGPLSLRSVLPLLTTSDIAWFIHTRVTCLSKHLISDLAIRGHCIFHICYSIFMTCWDVIITVALQTHEGAIVTITGHSGGINQTGWREKFDALKLGASKKSEKTDFLWPWKWVLQQEGFNIQAYRIILDTSNNCPDIDSYELTSHTRTVEITAGSQRLASRYRGIRIRINEVCLYYNQDMLGESTTRCIACVTMSDPLLRFRCSSTVQQHSHSAAATIFFIPKSTNLLLNNKCRWFPFTDSC